MTATIERVRAAGWHMATHLSMTDAHVMTYRCPEYPRLTISDRTPRGRAKAKGEKPSRIYIVTGIEKPFDNLPDALRAMNELVAVDLEA